MRVVMSLADAGGIALALAIALGGCSKVKQIDPRDVGKARVQAKRQQTACASPAAYGRLKGLLFDQAISAHSADRANLDTLADYSSARMDDPVVKGWDPALDVTQCKGHFTLEFPPGAERAFAGKRRLEADLEYTAQAAADGNGFVYQVKGGEPIVAQLAAFNLASAAYRPPPAMDERPTEPQSLEPTALDQADASNAARGATPTQGVPPVEQRPVSRPPGPVPRPPSPPTLTRVAPERTVLASGKQSRIPGEGKTGEATVRAFYHALGTGDGVSASAQVIPEKRSSRAFSPQAISRFYGTLPEPIRLTQIVPLSHGAYRVSYRYSAGRSHCNGSAIVSLATRGDRNFIRTIRALRGC